MKKYFVEQTVKTPFINFDPEMGLLEIKGRSVPDDATKLYQPAINEWLNEYIENPAEKTLVNIDLEYFNTSSSMWLFHFFKKLQSLHEKKFEISINWHYDDEDSYEAGEDFQTLIPIPFTMIKV